MSGRISERNTLTINERFSIIKINWYYIYKHYGAKAPQLYVGGLKCLKGYS